MLLFIRKLVNSSRFAAFVTASVGAACIAAGGVYAESQPADAIPSTDRPGEHHRDHGPRHWDFECSFQDRGERCEAWATLFQTNLSALEDTTGAPENGGGVVTQPGYTPSHRMAVFCEDRGLIYANGASYRYWDHDEVAIMTPGGNLPAIVLDRHHAEALSEEGGDDDRRSREFEAELILSRYFELDGSCRVTRSH